MAGAVPTAASGGLRRWPVDGVLDHPLGWLLAAGRLRRSTERALDVDSGAGRWTLDRWRWVAGRQLVVIEESAGNRDAKAGQRLARATRTPKMPSDACGRSFPSGSIPGGTPAAPARRAVPTRPAAVPWGIFAFGTQVQATVRGMTNHKLKLVQVPAACTLPRPEQPLQLAEFRDVFALVRTAERPSPTRLILVLHPAPGRGQAVRDLAARESTCCAFFGFTVREEDDGVLLEVTVPPAQLGVLDAMAKHAEHVTGTAGRT